MLIGARRRLMVEKPALVGRERELQELVRFLDAVPSGPVGLLFEGDAGIGKTTLWMTMQSSPWPSTRTAPCLRPALAMALPGFGPCPAGVKCCASRTVHRFRK